MSGILLHLMRHGAPETPGLLMGRTDGIPTRAGIASCVEQASGLDVMSIVSSDLRRARLSAEAIGGKKALPVRIDPRWRELDFGEWDGFAPSVIDRKAMARFWEDPDACPPPGGERWSTLIARVGTAIDALKTRSTLVVTHGGTIRAALMILCGFDHRQLWGFDLPYGALLSLRIWRGERISAQIVGLRS